MHDTSEHKAYLRRQERRFPQHYCELPEHPDRVYPVLPPTASRWEHWRRVVQQQVVAWSWARPLRALLPSTYSLEAEQARQTQQRYWWILHPFSRLFTVWQLVVIASVTITTCLVPLQFGLRNPYSFIGLWDDDTIPVPPFMDDENPGTKEYITHTSTVGKYLYSIYHYNDLVFDLHVAVIFIAGYYEPSSKEVVLTPSRIIKRYLRTWFVPDVLSIIEYRSGFADISSQRNIGLTEVSSSAELAYLPKLWMIFYCFRILRLHYVFTYTSNWCRMANLRPVTRRAILYVILFAGFIVWATAYSVQIPLIVQQTRLFRNGCESWLVHPELGFFDVSQPNLLARQLLLALNRVVGVASTHIPHFSKDTPQMTFEDTVILLVIMWISAGFQIVLIGLILEYVENSNSAEVEVEKIRSQMRNYLRDNNLPVNVRKKILLFYTHRFEGRYFKERAIIAQFPPSIRDAVQYSSCRQLISSSPLFRHVPKALVNNIVSSLREELFLPHDVVYASGDPARYLYFLAQGTVAVFLSTGEEVGHLSDNSSFGEMGLMLREHRRRHLESVVALEVCEVFLLKRSDLERLVRPLPRLYNRIRAAAMLRAEEVSYMELEDGNYGGDYTYEDVRRVSRASTSSFSRGRDSM